MKLESYDELRYVECKNADCPESIPLPDRTLLEPTAYLSSTGGVFPPVYLACMRCGHVYEYTPSEVRYLGAGGTLGLDPEMELYHGATELRCNSVDCGAPATIHVPTYADGDINALRAQVSKITLFDVYCRHGQRVEAVPSSPVVLFYS
jgi:hypothetical protein